VTALPAAAGCAQCDGTGFRGRVGIFELLVVDARVRSLILKRVPAHSIRAAARASGMATLGQDAWAKVSAGITTPEEVAPLLSLLSEDAPLCPGCGRAVQSGFQVCPACGRQLRQRCTCGATIQPDWKRCARCGSGLRTARLFDDHDPPDLFTAPAA
jgi:hypothetical protein